MIRTTMIGLSAAAVVAAASTVSASACDYTYRDVFHVNQSGIGAPLVFRVHGRGKNHYIHGRVHIGGGPGGKFWGHTIGNEVHVTVAWDKGGKGAYHWRAHRDGPITGHSYEIGGPATASLGGNCYA